MSQVVVVGVFLSPPQEFYGVDPKSSPDYGRIINQHHFNRVLALMEGYAPVVGGQSDASQCYIGVRIHFHISTVNLVGSRFSNHCHCPTQPQQF